GNTANVSDGGDSDAKTGAGTEGKRDSDGDGEGMFTLDFKDLAGNDATQVTAAASSVTFDKTKPTATVTITSSNSNGARAKVGDTVTLAITADEDVQEPIVQIAGHTANVSDGGDSNA